MQGLTKQKHFYYVAFMLMASTFLPLVFNNLPPLIRSHHIWTSIWVMSLLFFYPQIFINKMMLYVLGYGLFLLIATAIIWIKIDDWNYNLLFMEFYEIAISVSVITYFYQSRDFIGLAKITRWAIFFLFVTAIMTIVSSAIDPLYARNLGGITSVVNENQKEAILSFKQYGGGTYSTAAAFMCLFPILIYYFKENIISPLSKKQIVVYLIIIFFALIGMQIFANILIAVVFSFFALLGVGKIKKSILLIGLFLSIIAITPKDVYVNALLNISDYFGKDSELNYKFRDLAIFIEAGADIEDNNTGASERAERYPMLIDAFIKSPLLGCYTFSDELGNGYNILGAHLHWMNKLTVTGIIGLFFFLFIPYSFIKKNLKYCNSTYRFYYILASLSILSYGLTKTIVGRETWYSFFIILPGLNYLYLLRSKRLFVNRSLKKIQDLTLSSRSKPQSFTEQECIL